MKEPGAILLVACYELGHQPLAVAWPAAFLERGGHARGSVTHSPESQLFELRTGRGGPTAPLEYPPPSPPPLSRDSGTGEAAVSGAESREAAVAEEVHAPGAQRRSRAGGPRRGEPRLQAHVPALSHPSRVRRAFLRRACRRAARGHPAAGGYGRDPHHVRRSRLSERPRPRPGRRPSPPRRLPEPHLRLHGEDRAPLAPPRPVA